MFPQMNILWSFQNTFFRQIANGTDQLQISVVLNIASLEGIPSISAFKLYLFHCL